MENWLMNRYSIRMMLILLVMMINLFSLVNCFYWNKDYYYNQNKDAKIILNYYNYNKIISFRDGNIET